VSAEDAAFARALSGTIRDLDIDAFADGVLAHRNGLAFHENPHGGAQVKTVARLSWAYGWNERALAHG
jgi:hypothetical protein